MLINLEEQHRHEGGLPIVTVDDVGCFAALSMNSNAARLKKAKR